MHAPDPIKELNDAVEVRVLVVPNTSRNEIVGLHGDRIRIRVTAPPEHGKANSAVCALLCATTGARSGTVTQGGSSRHKTVVLSGVSHDTVRHRLGLEAV